MPPYDDPYRAAPGQGQQEQTGQPTWQHDAPYEDHAYTSNQSTEKMVDEPGNTERLRKGRQNIPAPQTWAEMGPPPRSTGILRMWRKDERGKQWSRVRVLQLKGGELFMLTAYRVEVYELFCVFAAAASL